MLRPIAAALKRPFYFLQNNSAVFLAFLIQRKAGWAVT
jgi:hypothetical protein